MRLENGGNIFPLPLQFISGIAKAFFIFFSLNFSQNICRHMEERRAEGRKKEEERKRERAWGLAIVSCYNASSSSLSLYLSVNSRKNTSIASPKRFRILKCSTKKPQVSPRLLFFVQEKGTIKKFLCVRLCCYVWMCVFACSIISYTLNLWLNQDL